MNQYLQRLKEDMDQYGSEYTVMGNESALKFLWNCYAETNPIDDGRISSADASMAEVLLRMEPGDADVVFDRISDLCLAYQRAAFLEGIQVGACLERELRA